MRKALPFLLLMPTYLLLGALFVIQTPAWQAPDEPAHYNYVRQLAHGRLPVMEAGDYDETFRNQIVSSRFDPQYDIRLLTYEDWQPPLYYLLQTPVYLVSDGSLTAMRLVSLLLGAGVILLAHSIARQLLPAQPWVAWTTAVIVAFLPQHLAMMASVNNDSLAELLIAAILLLLVRWLAQPDPIGTLRLPLSIGLLLGLGLLTKGTVYLMVPVVATAVLWRCWRRWSDLWRVGTAVFLPALLLGMLWWGRNLAVYGGLDFMGKTRHDAVVVGQIRTADWIAQFGLAETGRRFFQTTFNSFWGQFGWMAVPMPGWVYRPLVLLTVAAAIGLVVAFFVWPPAPTKGKRHQRLRALLTNPALICLLLLAGLTAGLHIGYNVTFVQHQGRYLFPALIPLALGMAMGLGGWGIWVTRPWSNRSSHLLFLLPVGLGLAFVALDLVALYRFILPSLAP